MSLGSGSNSKALPTGFCLVLPQMDAARGPTTAVIFSRCFRLGSFLPKRNPVIPIGSFRLTGGDQTAPSDGDLTRLF